ncbi:ubiquitin-associated protein 2-like [Pseudonaja textilis]|uniref:ubiquitin-associated protein 2-like n=1 Tax=Pseudonaja textilis TaxID=8673 RepID=UPI000EAAC23E|nr:ubiquitin-associated protein 2-like [Pseudonaja textilis]
MVAHRLLKLWRSSHRKCSHPLAACMANTTLSLSLSLSPQGVSVSSSNTGMPDISGSVYNKAQTFDKQGFHAGTPPPFNLPSALSSTGPLNPGAAAGYAPAPFLHILPAHQQPHSQVLHHHLQQDGQVSGWISL